MIRVVLIGAGNVASHLYKSFSKSDQLHVIQVFNRDISKIDFVEGITAKTSDLKQLLEADLYLIAVKDEAIQEVAEKLGSLNGIVVHTSGSEPMQALSSFKSFGVFYPLQSFSKDKPVNFKEVPLCIEASSKEGLIFLRKIAGILSDQVYEVDSEQRKTLHLSAVFVNNFSNHLFALAASICQKEDLPFAILQPLLKETVKKLDHMDPYSAQTGPALRNDQKTISAHLEMLDDDQREIYTILTKSIQHLHGKKL